jgi:manganese oxidase
MQLLLRSIALSALVCAPLHAQTLPRIAANHNRVPAGTLKDGVLTLELSVVRGMWHPERDNEPGVEMLAFAEVGHAPTAPGPLIRVPIGTEIRTTIRNTWQDTSLLVIGLSGNGTATDSVRLQPGEVRELRRRVVALGTTVYRASKFLPKPGQVGPGLAQGTDALLGGALIVDEPGHRINDRVLVLQMWRDTARLRAVHGMVREILTINGKSWPNTEPLEYELRDTIRWRVINASFGVHPMHLHGAYFNVLSRGSFGRDTIYSTHAVRQVVTERMGPITTMTLEWTPQHAGNWAFHCHLTPHITPHVPVDNQKASAENHDEHDVHGMSGLIMGVTVRGPVPADTKSRRNLRLLVEQYDSVAGDMTPRYSYELDDARRMTIPGPPIIVQRNEPIAITVVNRAKEPTSVHWHGLEIESYYDGVPSFGGNPGRSTPMVGQGDSFVVKMTPPRAGTFMYHTHASEERQQHGGLYAAFIVLPAGERWDPEHERIIILGTRRDSLGSIEINGQPQPRFAMKPGVTYRLRMINITLANPNVAAFVTKDDKLVEWKLIAVDGADLPVWQSGIRPATIQPFTLGQTFDALFTPAEVGDYRFDIKSPAGDVVASATFEVRQ